MLVKRTRIIAAAAAVLALAIGESLLVMHGAEASSKAAEAVAAPEVDVAAVLSKDITDWQNYSGRLQAIDHVVVRALVPGTITAVYFKDGALVKKGDPLFLIDQRPYVAAVDQAAAQLAAAKARASFAGNDYERGQKLLSDNAIAKRDFDAKSNNALEANANVKAAQAALEAAQVNLGYTKIVAPVSGRVSRAELTVGNIVTAGATAPALTTLVSVSSMYASFDVDEKAYLRYLSQGSKAAVPVRLGLSNESGYQRLGKVTSVDNQLNTSSGTIRVRAMFDNADGVLLPGLYARVLMGGGEPHPAVLIDDRAVSTDQAKKYVLVVDAKSRAEYREVTLGEIREGFRVIETGLKPGERIVVSGLQRVHPGEEVKANPVKMTGENVAQSL